ncbi:VanZ family protein [Paenibacillus curdlanolyticus YK9]|uniref:VanZ family protein n=1 Tax=Paenibacillus curdlanolyticus YK9 TaxID=717606 RepID=E0I9L1_9BACL|nr:VanZ family protein [Paenibacillus curdlanolyticus]EFM11095.1 VanZ family protein [Paenibacillus curdlanolyticus YK9]
MAKRMQVKAAAPAAVLFIVYMYVLVKIILFKFGEVNIRFLWHQGKAALANMDRLSYGIERANLEPFRTITGNLESHAMYEYIQLYGNIGLFIPLGLFLAYFYPKRTIGLGTYGAVLALSFATTLLLESTQLLCSIGSFDVDDLILNTAGGILGCMLYHPFARKAKLQQVTPSIL